MSQQPTQPTKDSTIDSGTLVIKFADSKVPEFKELPGKDIIQYGVDNAYPQYLLHLYNKSSKHNAIINGKVTYIYGKGLKIENDPTGQYLIYKCNSYGEGLNEISYKALTDVEIFGGYRLKIHYDLGGQISEVYHLPFQTVRKTKEGNFAVRPDWDERFKRTEPVIYAPFDPNSENKKEPQVFEYNEYRPGAYWYPLPGYLGSINYIETDIRISQYHLSAISNGMFPSKLIQFFNGEPNDEGKRKLENHWNDKFSGSENAGKVLLMFHNDVNKAVQVSDLSATELDKQFTILNETVQQEVFSGHGITTPSLFGVMTSGKLGESTQLKEGFEIFKNTYVNVKQTRFEESLNWLVKYMGVKNKYELKDVDPIGFSLSEAGLLTLAQGNPAVTKWLIDKAGIDIEEGLPTGAPTAPQEQAMTNDRMTNLTGKQMQNIARISRKFGKGELTQAQALLMLKSGYGLSDEDAQTFLTGGEDV
jgi:hypothetical protein